MKITQRYPLEYLATSTFEADQEKIRWHYKNLITEFSAEFRYSDLDEKVIRIKEGARGALPASFLFFILTAVSPYVIRLIADVPRYVVNTVLCLLGTLTLVCFLLQFVKREFIYFSDRRGRPAFFFNLEQNPELADYILARIKNSSRYTSNHREKTESGH